MHTIQPPPTTKQLLQMLETADTFQNQGPTGVSLASTIIATVQAHALIRTATALESIAAQFERATPEDIQATPNRGDFK